MGALRRKENVHRRRELGMGFSNPRKASLLAVMREGSYLSRGYKEEVLRTLEPKDMKGTRVPITSGPTREAIDPVRLISNYSSGKRGLPARTLVPWSRSYDDHRPSQEPPPHGSRVINVVSAEEMYETAMWKRPRT